MPSCAGRPRVLVELGFKSMTSRPPATRPTSVSDGGPQPALVDQPARRPRGVSLHLARTGERRPVAAAADDELDEYVHLYTLNRGILATPFHNMAVMCPDTTLSDVSRHTEVFEDAVAELLGVS